jgi:hypothetical protein
MVSTEPQLPGLPMAYHPPYAAKEHLRCYGNGDNRFRTWRCAQPSALKVGDILPTGDRVLSAPRQGFNGGVFIHLTGGVDGHWIEVPSRIPIALLRSDDEEAMALHFRAERDLWHLSS